MTPRKLKNIRHDRHGTQAYLKHRGRFYQERWKASEHTLPERIQLAKDWLTRTRAAILDHQPVPKHGPRFEDDVDDYLASVASMPSIKDRTLHMTQWSDVFRGRDRNTVTPLEIRTQLERWRKTLSPSSCDKRRTALQHFYRVMNGKSGANPVRDVPKYGEEATDPRAQHPVTILRVLCLMRPSATRARLRVMLTTGWPPAQIAKLRPEHIDLAHDRAYIAPRRKGKGSKGRWLPLLPAAVAALKEFQREDAFTTLDKKGQPTRFSTSAVHKSWRLALGKLNAHRKALKLQPLSIRPYDIRHTFGTWIAHRLTDERAIQELMLHSRIEQTRRYTEQATTGRIERALATLATVRPDSPGSIRTTSEQSDSETRLKS